MNPKLPPDAFTFYVSLGPERSYQVVAEKYGVSKRTVTNTAVRDKWQERVVELEAKARQRTEEKILETLDEMNTRHLKMYKFVQAQALEALKRAQLDSGSDAWRAMFEGMKGERLVRGEPTERTESVEAIIKREYERWLKPVEEEDDGEHPGVSAA